MMLTLQRHDLKIKYLPGVDLSVADALSGSYLPETTETLIPDLEVNVWLPNAWKLMKSTLQTYHLSVTSEKYAEFQQATADDPGMQPLSPLVQNGCPKSKEAQGGCTKHCLPLLGLQRFRAQRLNVAHSLRKEMLHTSMNRIKVL